MSTAVSAPKSESAERPLSYMDGRGADIADPLPTVGIPGDRLYRLTVDQYDAMARAGILIPDDRVELFEGLLVKKMTKDERHVATTKRLLRFIDRVVPEGWHVAKEDPVVFERSVPEPDVSVVRGDIDDYLTHRPRPADVALVVEVADTSYAQDLKKKVLYAGAGIPIYWIANLNADRIEAFNEPTGPGPSPDYRSSRHYGRDDEIPVIIDGREVARLPVASLLAPSRPQ